MGLVAAEYGRGMDTRMECEQTKLVVNGRTISGPQAQEYFHQLISCTMVGS